MSKQQDYYYGIQQWFSTRGSVKPWSSVTPSHQWPVKKKHKKITA